MVAFILGQPSESGRVFGMDVFGWAVVAGVAGVVAVVVTVVMPFISDAILNRPNVVVTFRDPEPSGETFRIDLLNQGRSWVRIENPARLLIRDVRSGQLVVIPGSPGSLGPVPMPFGGTYHTGDTDSTPFDGREVAARLTDMGYSGTQPVYGEYVGHDGKVYRSKEPYPIPIDSWAATYRRNRPPRHPVGQKSKE